jgi:hypothetical protein
MILTDLFTDIADFRRFAPYVESNVTFEELNSSALSAKKQITIILSRAVYEDILNTEGDDMKNALKSAMANLTLAKQMVFDIIKRRKDDIDIYKHEQESMRRAYQDNYFNAMDTLIQLLTEGNSESWKKTRYYISLEKLKIRSADEFDALYPIDLSYLFFFRTVPLQQEALDDGIRGYFDRADGKEDAAGMLLRCLAKQTVAIALRRFDIIEFPPTIRSLFDDSTVSRSGKDEQQRMLDLASQLSNEVQTALADIDLILNAASGGSVDTETSFNRPDDKIYLMA